MVVPLGRALVPLRAQCPTHRLFGVLGDRWSVLVLIAVQDNGELRSADLHRAVAGVSRKMLTESVRKLARHGLLERCSTPTVPVSVSYRLTPLGTDLLAALAPLRRWAEAHADGLPLDRPE